jgi:hypothetical protein
MPLRILSLLNHCDAHCCAMHLSTLCAQENEHEASRRLKTEFMTQVLCLIYVHLLYEYAHNFIPAAPFAMKRVSLITICECDRWTGRRLRRETGYS